MNYLKFYTQYKKYGKSIVPDIKSRLFDETETQKIKITPVQKRRIAAVAICFIIVLATSFTIFYNRPYHNAIINSGSSSLQSGVLYQPESTLSNESGSISGTQSGYYDVSGFEIHRDEPVTYKFASVDEFKQKMINKEVKTYKPVTTISVPANDKLISKISQVVYYYYENVVEFLFNNNDFHIYSISVTMYPPEEYTNQQVVTIMTRDEFEQQTENLETSVKTMEIGNSKYQVTKIYSKKDNHTDLRVSTIINETYILNIYYTILAGNVDFNASMIEDIVMENIKV